MRGGCSVEMAFRIRMRSRFPAEDSWPCCKGSCNGLWEAKFEYSFARKLVQKTWVRVRIIGRGETAGSSIQAYETASRVESSELGNGEKELAVRRDV